MSRPGGAADAPVTFRLANLASQHAEINLLHLRKTRRPGDGLLAAGTRMLMARTNPDNSLS